MVSAWWLLVAFWIGGLLGMALTALMTASRNRDDDGPRSGDEPPLERPPWRAAEPQAHDDASPPLQGPRRLGHGA